MEAPQARPPQPVQQKAPRRNSKGDANLANANLHTAGPQGGAARRRPVLSQPALVPGPVAPRAQNGARPVNPPTNGVPDAPAPPSPIAQGAQALPVGAGYAPVGAAAQPYYPQPAPPKNARKRPAPPGGAAAVDPALRKRRPKGSGAAKLETPAGADEYTCQYCRLTFEQKRQRAIHVRTHHERAFPCEKCERLFKTKSDANRHLRIVHERVRPYPCTECTATFAERGKLRRHKQTVHEKLRPFRCEFCGAMFGERGNLNQHQTSRHAGSVANSAAHPAS